MKNGEKRNAPFAFSFEAASDGNPVIFTRMHHTEVCASLYMKMKMPIMTTLPRIISLRFISKKFPRLLAEREIIANASLLVRISPRTDGKGTKKK